MKVHVSQLVTSQTCIVMLHMYCASRLPVCLSLSVLRDYCADVTLVVCRLVIWHKGGPFARPCDARLHWSRNCDDEITWASKMGGLRPKWHDFCHGIWASPHTSKCGRTRWCCLWAKITESAWLLGSSLALCSKELMKQMLSMAHASNSCWNVVNTITISAPVQMNKCAHVVHTHVCLIGDISACFIA